MALQFIIGGAGTGKSYKAYEQIIREAGSHPDVFYYIIVPEQFTMQTQKTVVQMSPGGGILNIDVVSITRLAYRVFEETGGDTLQMLDDIGKSMILMRLVSGKEKDYPYLGSQIRKPGCLDEVKSLISELMQYDISPEETLKMAERSQDRTLLSMKLTDVSHLYQEFLKSLENRYMTGEGVLQELCKAIPLSNRLKGSVILLDGFTGFTPVQLNVLRELLAVCRDMTVTLTMDAGEPLSGKKNSWSLFSMSKKMVRQLSHLTEAIREPILLKHGPETRFADAKPLMFLEQNLFRYKGKTFGGDNDRIRIFCAPNPLSEMQEAARIICRLVREKGLRYGEAAVVTGNLETYGPAAREAFQKAGIPAFIDETRSILKNPFVEYLRASLELVERNYSYDSVFRYLRTGLSEISREETDHLENYVRALGIHGFSAWNEKWVRLFRGMDPEEIGPLNEIREKLIAETGELRAGLSGSKTVQEHCTQLFYFLRRNRIQEKLHAQTDYFRAAGEKALEKEYAQVYGIVIELFDRMTAVLGEEKMPRRDFIKILETGLTKAKVALIPPGQDQVLVGDIERTRLKDVKVVFFAGVNEGIIPKAVSTGGILSENDRDFLAAEGITLAPDPKEQMNIQRFYLYLNLTKPSEYLFLSYSMTSPAGEALRPAYLIGTMTSLFPSLRIRRAGEDTAEFLPERPVPGLDALVDGLLNLAETPDDPLFRELLRWYLRDGTYEETIHRIARAAFMRAPSGTIGSAAARALYGEVPENGATRLERFAACACAHFMQYGLGLAERQEFEFRAADLGNLVHQVLEEFAKKLKQEGISFRTMSDEERDSMIDLCLNEAAAGYGNRILESSARNRWMIGRAGRILRRTIWALQQQIISGRFEPEGAEIAFGGGRIDRVDLMEEDNRIFVKVIDYKTGNTTFELLKLVHGLQIQLVLYMDAALSIEKQKHPGQEVIPAGIFYYNVKNPVLEAELDTIPEEMESKMLKELKMNGICSSDLDVIRAMDRTAVSLPVTLSAKTGELDQRSKAHTADPEQFEGLIRYVKDLTKENRARILSGEAAAKPYRMNNQNIPCDYCAFRPACGFDKGIPGFSYNEIRKADHDELWKRIMEGEERGNSLDQ